MSEPRLGAVLFTREAIAARVAEIAAELNARFAGRSPVVVAVLKGATVFLADLLRRLTFGVAVDFVRIASYGAGTSPGEIRFIKDVELPLAGRDVIVVDDIVDSGGTLARLRRALEAHRPASITTVALLRRAPKRRLPPTLDLLGFELTTEAFVAGYGIDCAERFRELDAIYAVEGTG
ncbi:MAG TPA: phosphoribosyltransferase family protein [Gemmatimonadales bacterium]|nr:phosphoribosyltransferase family protein [Gemmatimonadales bacterium]